MIFIALGANLPSSEGAPRETLRRAVSALAARGVKIRARSRLYLTEPVPRSRQPWYTNQIIAVETALAPEDLLRLLLDVEKQFGRERSERNASRTLDLDLVAYGQEEIATPELTLPHPRMAERAFVLAPLADIAPDWRHPATGRTVRAMLAEADTSNVRALRAVPLLMGVVNVTPDSFSDGGHFSTADRAIAHALALMNDGADILDIGGESTRPGSEPVDPDAEWARIGPVIEAVAGEARQRHRLVSVDTRHARTMARAIAAGATMINDITALADPESRRVLAGSDVPVILMHMQGEPRSMQINPVYDDVVEDVSDELRRDCDRAVESGIDASRLWLDPGLGFGKTLEHNLALLDATPRLRALGYPVLIGASRKSLIGRVDRDGPAAGRIGGSVAAAIAAAARGADAVRVHDVAETRQALAVWSAVEGESLSDAGR
ncbi:dihydropteroate synthase [Labrys monachus]|uniref:Dihydropteroate synthase/2-amino-4-hydroxy-6-hydroxymethyldihydropteridine diphosphokinase n=1 Tax=Labrys monachus TaxID=217067 RepID=A0ABU0FHH6_9HYPH|nr:dihydropteroate synthase [Labrys monachus]MDQ0394061.1 dihydropteroate synthase/2-amino-4-hydroxy-6-hydroxymethyldihydropteridine diphosphokinase [Labrys monachus]